MLNEGRQRVDAHRGMTLAVLVAMTALLSACAHAPDADEEEQASVVTRGDIDSGPRDVRSYSVEQLRRTGAADAGGALRRLDTRMH